MSLKDEFKKPYNVIGSAILVVLILIWVSPPGEPSEIETVESILTFMQMLPRDESEDVCEGLEQMEREQAGKYPELDELKARVRTTHNCDDEGEQ